MADYSELGEAILRLYTRGTYGRVLKSEIDSTVFHFYLLGNLKQEFAEGGKVRYFHIDKSEIYRLSLRMRMTEDRFKKLLEEDYFLNQTDVDVRGFLQDKVNAASIRKDGLKEGRLRLVLPNPVVRKYVEERMYSVGSAVEYGQNREIAYLEIYEFLRMIGVHEDAEDADTIRANILQKTELKDGSPEITEFFRELNKVPIGERLKSIATGLAQRFLGKAGDEIIGMIFEQFEGQDGAGAK